jgi:hypothetical protein
LQICTLGIFLQSYDVNIKFCNYSTWPSFRVGSGSGTTRKPRFGPGSGSRSRLNHSRSTKLLWMYTMFPFQYDVSNHLRCFLFFNMRLPMLSTKCTVCCLGCFNNVKLSPSLWKTSFYCNPSNDDRIKLFRIIFCDNNILRHFKILTYQIDSHQIEFFSQTPGTKNNINSLLFLLLYNDIISPSSLC